MIYLIIGAIIGLVTKIEKDTYSAKSIWGKFHALGWLNIILWLGVPFLQIAQFMINEQYKK